MNSTKEEIKKMTDILLVFLKRTPIVINTNYSVQRFRNHDIEIVEFIFRTFKKVNLTN